jgi:hypothetical protein
MAWSTVTSVRGKTACPGGFGKAPGRPYLNLAPSCVVFRLPENKSVATAALMSSAPKIAGAIRAGVGTRKVSVLVLDDVWTTVRVIGLNSHQLRDETVCPRIWVGGLGFRVQGKINDVPLMSPMTSRNGRCANRLNSLCSASLKCGSPRAPFSVQEFGQC